MWLPLCLSVMGLGACTAKVINYSPCIMVQPGAKIAVVPFSNNTETPLAGERAMSIAAGVLESRGMTNLVLYQSSEHGKVLFPGMNKVDSEKQLGAWAKRMHARYLVTGSVNEWSYKVGLDGEPVVGVSIQLIDLVCGRIVWTSVGSLSGGSRVAVSTTAQQLMNMMLSGLSCPRNLP